VGFVARDSKTETVSRMLKTASGVAVLGSRLTVSLLIAVIFVHEKRRNLGGKGNEC